MSTKENQELMRWLYEQGVNVKGDVSKVSSILEKWMAPDGIYHTTTGDLNFEQYKQHQSALFIAFPDLSFTVEDMIASEDKVVARWTARGTHKGAYMGIAPTGKSFKMSGIGIARFVKGKAMEGWGVQDTLGLMQQLGIIPKR
jgi:predicted ester cyclase